MTRPRITLEPHHTPKQLQHHYQKSTCAVERRRTQAIWFLRKQKPVTEVLELTAYSNEALRKIIKRYNQTGLEGLKDQRHQNQGAPTLLSDQEMLLLAQTIRADFNQGIIWNGNDVVNWVKQELKREIHPQRAYEFLAASGITLQLPRPQHVQNDPGLMEDFKKTRFPKPSKQLVRLLKKLNSGPVTNTALV